MSKDFCELITYSSMTNGHLDWWIRENSLELLEDFRKGKKNEIF